MPRAKAADSDLAAMRAEIAELARSVSRIETEVSQTRATLHSGKAAAGATNGNGHHLTEDVLAGAMKFAGEAAGMAEGTVHAGVTWLDDVLRKNPTPVVLTAIGVGFMLGVMGRR
jgi:hypothetical protein